MKSILRPLVLLLAGLLLLGLAGCACASPPDFPNLASALKFIGRCSVLSAIIWGVCLVLAAKFHKK
jgi:hypothetical protein